MPLQKEARPLADHVVVLLIEAESAKHVHEFRDHLDAAVAEGRCELTSQIAVNWAQIFGRKPEARIVGEHERDMGCQIGIVFEFRMALGTVVVVADEIAREDERQDLAETERRQRKLGVGQSGLVRDVAVDQERVNVLPRNPVEVFQVERIDRFPRRQTFEELTDMREQRFGRNLKDRRLRQEPKSLEQIVSRGERTLRVERSNASGLVPCEGECQIADGGAAGGESSQEDRGRIRAQHTKVILAFEERGHPGHPLDDGLLSLFRESGAFARRAALVHEG